MGLSGELHRGSSLSGSEVCSPPRGASGAPGALGRLGEGRGFTAPGSHQAEQHRKSFQVGIKTWKALGAEEELEAADLEG